MHAAYLNLLDLLLLLFVICLLCVLACLAYEYVLPLSKRFTRVETDEDLGHQVLLPAPTSCRWKAF